MAAKSSRLTASVRTHILSSLRSGGYLHIAAEAWGVPRALLDIWLEKGNGLKAREPYASFARDALEAQGQARLRAEVEVFQNDPRYWLEHGPGRETARNPGWSGAVKAAETTREERNPWLDAEVMGVLRVVVDALTPHPELREQVARLITETPPTRYRRAA